MKWLSLLVLGHLCLWPHCVQAGEEPLKKNAAPVLRVLSFNVLGCRGFSLKPGAPVVFKEVSDELVKALAGKLVEWKMDVVLLQEAPPEASVGEIGRLSGMHTAFFAAQSLPGPEWPFGFPGAVISKYPITQVEDRAAVLRSTQDERFARHWGAATLQVGAQVLRVQCMHLCADWGGVRRESTRLAEVDAFLLSAPGDLVAADCNTRPGEAPWRLLVDAGWKDAWREAGVGEGLSSDTRRRHQRIDYVWLAPGTPWRVHSIRVLEDLRVTAQGGELLLSDHFPLAAELVYEASLALSSKEGLDLGQAARVQH